MVRTQPINVSFRNAGLKQIELTLGWRLPAYKGHSVLAACRNRRSYSSPSRLNTFRATRASPRQERRVCDSFVHVDLKLLHRPEVE